MLGDRGVFGLIDSGARCFTACSTRSPISASLSASIPIAVVDQDHTELSRSLIQTLDADEARDGRAARRHWPRRSGRCSSAAVFGILEIPPGTEREVLKGDPARLPAYVDSPISCSSIEPCRASSRARRRGRCRSRCARRPLDGSLCRAALAAAQPGRMLTEPLFNPTGGYASYVVPAAFVLILQQTLLMGAATLGGVALSRRPRRDRRRARAPRACSAARSRI